ncbi:MAG: hypothetical protein PHF84_09180 [bacterium]|nr:hypothetical protein [bacterium]
MVLTAILDNSMACLVILLTGLTVGISSLFLWASCVLTGLFSLGFILFYPRNQGDGA